jgi:hypothetical protein
VSVILNKIISSNCAIIDPKSFVKYKDYRYLFKSLTFLYDE